MSENSGFEIKYMGAKNFLYTPRARRNFSFLKYLWVFLYFALLVASPFLIYLWGTQAPKAIKAISATSTSIYEQAKKAESFEVIVLNNDSYWKISERYCGDGKYYLSIRQLNQEKALFEGDSLKVLCQL